jgi:2-methylcitrate dehydratase PrpD
MIKAGFMNGTSKQDAIQLKQSLNAKIESDPESIALWMGSTARMLDIDDGHRFAMAHPGVVVNSSAIAMAIILDNVSGKKLIEAITKGYEMYCYQGRVINPSAYLKRGVDATCVCGAAAAAVVAGTLMEFNDKQMADAISLAASLAGGLNQSAIDGSAQKYLVAGWGAKLGIAAANLAKAGMGGPSRVFEGKLGFCNAFSPDPDLEYLNNPKLVWDVKSVYIKMYACVRRIHATLDAINDIVKEEKIALDDVQSINVYGSQFLFDAGGYDPIDMAQAQTSVPYVVSILMKYGCVEDDLVHENIGNKEISEYSRKVTVIKDPDIIALAEKDKSLWGAARVEIITKSGKSYSKEQIVPYGDPESPLPQDAVKNKFVKHVEMVTDEKYASNLWNSMMSLEEDDSTKSLFDEMLTKTS